MYSKSLRITAFVVAVFFAWTIGGFSTMAHAADQSLKQSRLSRPAQQRGQGPEARLASLTAEIEKILDAEGGLAEKKGKLRERLGRIETLDLEIRKEFAATWKKLRDADFPAEILERHQRFVEHYDANLKELKDNLRALERASDRAAFKRAADKAKAHLERTKPPSRHQPLDPNKLPHRAAEPTKKQPRRYKEEFERDYGTAKADKPKRILLAYNGSPFDFFPYNDEEPAPVIPAPSAADLAETPEVQLTDAIVAKAAELEHDPVKIFNWVRNTIEFAPTWGSIQGAQMAMETRQGNAMDTASLLIALLRASGIHARYVIGTVELPIDKVMNWAGGFTDPDAALDFMSSGGIPTTALTEGGRVVAARFEHVWVEAWVDYLPSRGARHTEGDTWIALDPSYKQYAYTDGIDLAAEVPFDAQSFVDELTSTATINEAEGYATGVDSLLVQQAMSDYKSQGEAYIIQQYAGATVGDLLGRKEIVVEDYPYLLGTLPYETAVRGGAYALLPASVRHTLTFTVQKDAFDETPINITASLPDLAGKKITLSYSPATQGDEDLIESYLPEPRPDGTPIQPEDLPTSLPAYLIKVKPELRIDEQLVAIGSAVSLGAPESFDLVFKDPSVGSSRVSNTVDAGSYHGIALDLGAISNLNIEMVKENINNSFNIAKKYNTTSNKDKIFGDLLYGTALIYHAELNVEKFIAKKILNIASHNLPSEVIFSLKLRTEFLYGVPYHASISGMNMDADRLLSITKSLDGDRKTLLRYMKKTGLASSRLEHEVPEKLFSSKNSFVNGISAVKAIKIANDSNIPIFIINKENIDIVIDKINIDFKTKEEIRLAVLKEKYAIVPMQNVQIGNWIGVGYILYDKFSGSGAFMISTGTSGADIPCDNTNSGWGGLLKNALVLSIIHYLNISAAAGEFGLSILAAFYDGEDLDSATGYSEFLNVGADEYEISEKVDKLLSTIMDFALDLAKEISIGKVGEIAEIVRTIKDHDGGDLTLIYKLLVKMIDEGKKIIKSYGF